MTLLSPQGLVITDLIEFLGWVDAVINMVADYLGKPGDYGADFEEGKLIMLDVTGVHRPAGWLEVRIESETRRSLENWAGLSKESDIVEVTDEIRS